MQTFPAYLCSHWLEPISANLKALSLSHRTDKWGPFPGYFDPSGIPFPKLEVLTLGDYMLAHDNDFDWVLAIKSLRKLILKRCKIVSFLRIDHQNMIAWKVQTHDWNSIPGAGWCAFFTYAGNWSQCLDRIAGELPNLVEFRCGNMGAKVSPERYIWYDNGTLPTHWQGAEDDGKLDCHDKMNLVDFSFPANKHEEHLEADQKSLDALLEKLRLRR
jgi:hypothetical protein